ncbi:methyltransferase domain-containing protein [Aquisalinus flavus]|uniref:SAM-dependent methyltransferase n=1 Tax=Aquisalinus flavus TaxID=1526572 RepID=A0A8J2V560_9PROT|nr:methyltransferase domain-containing protein [Aquisalinus flavus]MBD0427878.1 methyltransferase domain-containing protein [Aquisalinus flavus]UNE47639.1 methyltransferase domain-containing protein [Aquisalinus flavus]GGD04595.1 SAM-dependent methyltransferase [Aquisalinus flavus]
MSDSRPPPPAIFDRALLRTRQDRASRSLADHDFLHRYIAEDIVDRLESIIRSFDRAVFIGPGAHYITGCLTPACDVGHVVSGASSPAMARLGDDGASRATADEEALPFADASLDLIVSIMALQSVNRLPEALTQMRAALRPDGLLIAAFPGERSLHELRDSLYRAESEITGGVSPRLSPFTAIKDAGGLMQRAGLALPVADLIRLPVTYRNPMTLLADLRGMGETSVLNDRRKQTLRKDVLIRAMEIYAQTYPAEGGGVTATFEIVMLTGWAPHASQQKPLKPGQGKASMAEAVKTFEKRNRND